MPPGRDRSDGEGRRRLKDAPDPLDLVVELPELPARERRERLDRERDPPGGPPVMPDPGDAATGEDDGAGARLSPRQRPPRGVAGEEQGPRVAADDVRIE